MRTTKQITTTKSKCKHKVRKKRHKSRSTFGCSPGDSFLDLENINEGLRVNRINHQRSDRRGSWKVVPKDSCEVYKERRKRQERRDEQSQTPSEESLRQRRGRGEKKRATKTRRGKPARRRDAQSSESSHTSTTTSWISSSEMDCE